MDTSPVTDNIRVAETTRPQPGPEIDSASRRPAPVQAPDICLVGAPNSGKTTLMNALTGGTFHTANYPGVTVTVSRGWSKPELGRRMNLIDLPGIQSTVAPSPEEELSADVLEGRNAAVTPDAVVAVVDATQLERHLKLAAFATRLGKPLVIALTMTDLLARADRSLDPKKLEATLGVRIVPVDGRTGWGIRELIAAIDEILAEPRPPVNALTAVPEDPVQAYRYVGELIADSDALKRGNPFILAADSVTSRIDRIVLNRHLGFPIFFVVLVGLFASIFWVAQPFMDLIEAGFAATGELILRVLPAGPVARFIGEGLVGGVGAVAVFLPQIVILFFLMTLLEDSGYLARGAALVDRPLSHLGLHGRSFVPMLSGFACAIPAVFAARTIPSKRERLLTIWILPLMSCSARLPVYALLLAALIPGAPWKAGLALAAIYISSLLVGSLTAGLVGSFIMRKRSHSLLAMELPAYRKPLLRPTARMTWSRSSAYLRRAGVPIVVISSLLWLLSNLGPGTGPGQAQAEGTGPVVASSELENSFAGLIGHKLEPALEPMGVDWRVGVGLISAFAAREVFVSSMAIVFHVSGDGDPQSGLLERMRTATFAGSSRPVFTTASILGLIVFFFFSLQCLATVAVVKSETGSWVIAGLQLVFYTGLGYLLSTAVVQGLRLFGIE